MIVAFPGYLHLPSRHTMLKQRRFNVDSTPKLVESTLFQRCVFAGLYFWNGQKQICCNKNEKMHTKLTCTFKFACTKVQEELLHCESTGRAIALPLASTSALAAASALTKMLKFYVKVFKTSYFLNPLMDFVYIWYNYRCWSKILLSHIHIPAHDL